VRLKQGVEQRKAELAAQKLQAEKERENMGVMWGLGEGEGVMWGLGEGNFEA
jgi:hypothetical protein